MKINPEKLGYKRVSFGQEIESLIGACYEKQSGNEMFFSLGDGFLATDHEGLQASMMIFMELLMRRHCENNKDYEKLELESLKVDQVATPVSNFICGCSGVVHESNDNIFMKARLHCGESLIMSGTAIWSFSL